MENVMAHHSRRPNPIVPASLTARATQCAAKAVDQTSDASFNEDLIAKKFSDLKRFKAQFVSATCEVFWQALEAGRLPGQVKSHKSRR